MAEGFKVADAYVELTLNKDRLNPELDRALADIPRRSGPSADRSGRGLGDKLSQGMSMSIMRNSPLIVAAIAGVLAAGGPLLLTAATGLFAGIGIVAAAQSDKVRSSWIGTWNGIKAGAISDAGVIEPVLVQMAARVGGAFQAMRPQLRDAFAAAAPQIAVFTNGILDLAQNALPGLVRAVEQGMPVTQGFAAFLAKTGTGLSDFFDRITAHAPAAGAVWSQLGTTMGTLLPTLGELIGQGSELASTVLPLLNGGLSLVLSVVSALGPALPAVVAGFSAMKIARSVGGWIGGIGTAATKTAQSLAFASYSSGAFAGTAGLASRAAGAASGAMGMVSKVAGPLSIAIGLVSIGLEAGRQRMDGWVQALMQGGAAADAAREAMTSKSWVDGGIFATGSFEWLQQIAGAFGIGEKAAASTRAEYNRLVAAMSPLEQANLRVTQAQSYLNQMTDEYGPKSNQAEGAARALKQAQGELEQQNSDLELAIHGVTQAMLDQANQAMGSIDADFAYQDSLDALQQKEEDLAVAIRDHGKASEEAKDASRALAEGIWDTAKKAAAAAPELDGLKEGTSEYDRMVQNLTLRSLVELRKGLGPEMGAVVDGMIATLKRGGASLDEIGQKKPKPVVDADTGPLITKAKAADQILTALGGRKPLPGLDLATGPFDGKTQTSFNLMDLLSGKRPTPIANLNHTPLAGKTQTSVSLLDLLAGKRPTPVASLNPGNLPGTAANLLGITNNLGRQRPTPVATLVAQTAAAEAALNNAARNRTATVYLRQVGAQVAGGGKIGDVLPRGFAGGGSPGGKIRGPGGPTEDRVPAEGPGGAPLRLSATEWIIKAISAGRYGDARMAAVNNGTATVLMPGEEMPMRRAVGGPLARFGDRLDGIRDRLADVRDRAQAAVAQGTTIRVDNLTVKIETPLNLMSPADLRKAAQFLRAAIIGLERETS